MIFSKAAVYYNFLAKRKGETHLMKRGGKAVIVKHLTKQLKAWMAGSEVDVLGCKTHSSMLCMFDTVLCFTSTRLSEKKMKLMLSQLLRFIPSV